MAYIRTSIELALASPGLLSHTLHVMHALSISCDGVVRLPYMIRVFAREDVGRAKTVFSPPVLSLYVKSLRSYK